MNAEEPIEAFKRSLARAVARGRSVAAWAWNSDVDLEAAQAWSELREFRELVEKFRVEHADRMVGKIGQCVGRAIDRLVELSENSTKPNVALAATKAIIEKWIALAVYFEQEKKFKDMQARVKVLMDHYTAQKKTTAGKAWT